jgi:hypothetical protein
MAVADFDQDGELDLVVTGDVNQFAGGGGVVVLHGSPGGVFVDRGVRFLTGDSALEAVARDLNGDGLPDLAVATQGKDPSSAITVFFGNSNGTFDARVKFPVDLALIEYLDMGDFNGDGLLDFVAAEFISDDADAMVILLGQADGTFLDSGQVYEAGFGTFALSVGDFNGDGRPDVVTGNRDSLDVRIFLGQGDGTLAAPLIDLIGLGVRSLAVGDLNADGRSDLVAAGEGNAVIPLLGNGDGTFTTRDARRVSEIEATPQFADLSGDALADALLIDILGNVQVRLGRPNQTGLFAPAQRISDDLFQAIAIVRRPNLGAPANQVAALNKAGDAVTFFSISSTGASEELETLPLPGGVRAATIASADFNGDGLSDLILTDLLAGTVTVWLSGSAGFGSTGSSVQTLSVGTAPADLQVADLDGDGTRDLIVTNQTSGDVSLYFNDGSGHFGSEQRVRGGNGHYGCDLDADGIPFIRSEDRSEATVIGDFNADGLPDLLVVNPGTRSVALLFGTPAGMFADPVSDFTALAAAGVTIGQFNDDNGDGRADSLDFLDLALLDFENDSVVILAGDGQGGFTKIFEAAAGTFPTGLTTRDVNADGRLDLVIGGSFGDLLILPGNGDGTFQSFVRADQNVPIALADLDGDGITDDVVLANQSRDQLTVQRHGGGGPNVFSQSRTDGLLAPGAVVLADLDGDGRQEMVVANTGGNQVLVYRGEAGGNFTKAGEFFAGANPAGITADDVNGDGRTDLVVSNHGSNDVSVLFNNSTGDTLDFTPGPRLNVPTGPVSAQLIDGNGDGIPDLVVTSADAGTVSLLPGVGGGFFNDLTPSLINIGPTSLAGGSIFDGSFLAANPLTNAVSFIPNLAEAFGAADPEFLVRRISSGGSEPVDVRAGDFTGDGAMDLIVANSGDGSVVVLSGADGFEVFQRFSDAGLLHPNSLAIIGNGDMLQILVSDEGDDHLTVFDLGHAPELSDTIVTSPGFSPFLTGPPIFSFASIFWKLLEEAGESHEDDETPSPVESLLELFASASLQNWKRLADAVARDLISSVKGMVRPIGGDAAAEAVIPALAKTLKLYAAATNSPWLRIPGTVEQMLRSRQPKSRAALGATPNHDVPAEETGQEAVPVSERNSEARTNSRPSSSELIDAVMIDLTRDAPFARVLLDADPSPAENSSRLQRFRSSRLEHSVSGESAQEFLGDGAQDSAERAPAEVAALGALFGVVGGCGTPPKEIERGSRGVFPFRRRGRASIHIPL